MPLGYIIPPGLGDRVVVKGTLVTMSADPPNKGSRLTSVWKARAASACAEIRLSDAPTNSTVFAMYALSHEVRGADRSTEPWWELDFEFLGRQMDSVWINWFQAGKMSEQARFYVLTPPPRGLFRQFCLGWDIDNRTAVWTVDAVQIANLTMDETWDAPLSLIFSHWVGQPDNAHWVGGDRIEERVSVDVDVGIMTGSEQWLVF
jgi:hypothetical protein